MQFREDNNQDEDFLALQKKQTEKKQLKSIDHMTMEYEPFRKEFYIESTEIAQMTQEDVKMHRKELGNIQIRDKDCPKPILNWYQCGLSDVILALLTEKRKYDHPFPIQCQAIPVIMSGRDVIGVAETGSGSKTPHGRRWPNRIDNGSYKRIGSPDFDRMQDIC
jgi:ATP-dependent RNA helicase DDX46/PRP5